MGPRGKSETNNCWNSCVNYAPFSMMRRFLRQTKEVLFDYDFAMNYGNWGVVAKIGNGGSSAWDGSRGVDEEHWDLRFKLRAEQENDPSGAYIRRWVPELQNVDTKHIHTPWAMNVAEMQECGCVIGKDYPASVVGALEIADCVPDSAKELEDGQPGERRVDTASGKIYTFDENVNSFQGGYALKDLRMYWHRYMLIVVEQGEKRIDSEDGRALTFEKLLERSKSAFGFLLCIVVHDSCCRNRRLWGSETARTEHPNREVASSRPCVHAVLLMSNQG